MRAVVLLALALWPALAYAERTYTNADLVGFQVPGAYTNDDLRGLPPLAVQKSAAFEPPPYVPRRVPVAAFQALYDGLRQEREALAEELDLERARVAFSESAFAGDPAPTEGRPRLGYRMKAAPLMAELAKRVDLLDLRIAAVLEDARRSGAALETR
jgi:hypothetical protein